MSGWLGLLVGVLAAAATDSLLRPDRFRQALGLMLMGHAVNLLVFCMTGAQRFLAPLVAVGEDAPATPYTDPLPQALVLTAIVIGFALQAFALVLFLVPPAADPREGLGDDPGPGSPS